MKDPANEMPTRFATQHFYLLFEVLDCGGLDTALLLYPAANHSLAIRHSSSGGGTIQSPGFLSRVGHARWHGMISDRQIVDRIVHAPVCVRISKGRERSYFPSPPSEKEVKKERREINHVLTCGA